jgi:hypothetical protein
MLLAISLDFVLKQQPFGPALIRIKVLCAKDIKGGCDHTAHDLGVSLTFAAGLTDYVFAADAREGEILAKRWCALAIGSFAAENLSGTCQWWTRAA